MTMLRVAMLIMCVFLGGIGVIVGGAISIGMLRSGEVSYTVPEGGRTVSKTANRDRQPDEFWKVLALLGILPMALGAAATWYGWRSINRS